MSVTECLVCPEPPHHSPAICSSPTRLIRIYQVKWSWYCVSEVKSFTWNGKTVWNTAFGTAVPVWLICYYITWNNLQICTRPHSLSDLPARPCLSNRSFFTGLSCSKRYLPSHVHHVPLHWENSCIFSLQSPNLTCAPHETLHAWGVSPWKIDRTHFFLKLCSSPL